MAKTTAEINIELTLYQCCLADLAYNYVLKETTGQQNIECELLKLKAGVRLLEGLKCPDAILSLEQLTQTELEETLEKLSDLCGCMTCKTDAEIIDDTVSTVNSIILQEDGSSLDLEDDTNILD